MNVLLTYLYRDAGNYKQWGEIVFSNAAGTEPAILESEVRQYLMDGHWFVADAVGVPDLRPDARDEELDHGWHEFHSLAVTSASADDPARRDLRDWICELSRAFHSQTPLTSASD